MKSIVAKMARIPEKSVSATDKDLLRNLERNLKMVVFGQDKAIESLSSAIRLSRSGLGTERNLWVASYSRVPPVG